MDWWSAEWRFFRGADIVGDKRESSVKCDILAPAPLADPGGLRPDLLWQTSSGPQFYGLELCLVQHQGTR